jgi:hypothetical protein
MVGVVECFCIWLRVPMSKPIRVGFRDLVVSYLQTRRATDEHVDVPAITLEIVQSLVDVIMEQEQDDHGALFAFALTNLGEEYLQRRGAFNANPKGH